MTTETPTAPATVAPAAAPKKAAWETNGAYVAVTLTDALQAAIENAAKTADTTPGLLCRKIVADFLKVEINITRAPNGTPKTPEQKIAARDDDAVLRERLKAQYRHEQANPDWATTPEGRDARALAGEVAAIAKKVALAAKRSAVKTGEPDTDAVINGPAVVPPTE